MTRLLFLLFLIPSISFAAPNKITGKFDGGDAVTINRNFKELNQEVNNRVLSAPFTLNGTRGTGGTTAGLGTAAPSLLATTPYTWIDVQVGSVTCTMPVWAKQ
jgi:hypothetical protein